MTQHKVICEDSLSAMDEISRVLGKDAVILSTKKSNGKIEIIGSNDITDILKSQKTNKISTDKLKFKELFSKHPIKKTQSIDKENRDNKVVEEEAITKSIVNVKNHENKVITNLQSLFLFYYL